MRSLTRRLVAMTRLLPRGNGRALSLLARMLPELQEVAVPLRIWPERVMWVDLREMELQQFFDHGGYPYQTSEDDWCKAVLRPGDVVYDIGANVGYNALVFLYCIGAGGTLHAFEPSRRAFSFLRRNLLESDPVTLVNQAVGARADKVEFSDYAAFNLSSIEGFGSVVTRRFRPVDRYEVDVLCIDSYLAEGNPTPAFVKIDVEGYESRVLEGMSTLMREASPILLFESLGAEELEQNVEVISRLAPGAYRLVRIAHNGRLVALNEQREVTNNFFAIPPWAEERFASPPALSGGSESASP